MTRAPLARLALLTMVAVAATAPALAAGAAPPLPKVATGDVKPYAIRPAVVGGWTGNGSGYVGGAKGRPKYYMGSLAQRFGKIRWTRWTRREAVGVGFVWVEGCLSSRCAPDAWTRQGPTRIRAFRPKNGRFTRLTFAYNDGRGRKAHTYRLRLPSNDWYSTALS